MASREAIEADFDAIARLTRDVPERLGPHESWLLRNLPSSRAAVLEIGCGAGNLARRLAATFQRTVAIDFSAEMIRLAESRTPEETPIEYVCADMFELLRRTSDPFDCVVSSCVLHHVDLEAALAAMAATVKPGGRLLVLDVTRRRGLLQFPVRVLAWLVSRVRMAITFRGHIPRKLQEAWLEHGSHETYLTSAEARRIATAVLPGAEVRDHLLWRYSIRWDKPQTGQ
jgi:2-polyprenyl-3-methyl-5-hydroxy-6-metoxy-1,4-benzoquinol methylase